MALRLPRLINSFAIAEKEGLPTLTFIQWWDAFAKQIEASVNSITAALEAAGIAQTAATNAQAAADAAQAAADSVENVAKLSNSGTSGLTITATDAGSDVTINISSHTRLYGDGTSVSVDSGSLTTLAYSTKYYIYYDDSSFLGGAVTYQSTTDMATAAQTGNRHLVGSVTTPAASDPDVDGGVLGPPGIPGIEEP